MSFFHMVFGFWRTKMTSQNKCNIQKPSVTETKRISEVVGNPQLSELPKQKLCKHCKDLKRKDGYKMVKCPYCGGWV